MRVCIERDDTGAFTVSQENEGSGTVETQNQESVETENKIPARDLSDALMIAGKLLSKSDNTQSMFDSGMAKTMPNKNPVMPGAGGGMQ